MPDRPGDVLFTERTPRVVRARALLRRPRRDADRLFLAEGPQAVREAREAGAVTEVFATTEAALRYPELAGDRPSVVTDRALASLADTRHPQGLVAVCRYVDVPLAEALGRRPRLVAVLAGVADPGNAGTVLRTADAAGAGAVVFTDGSVDAYNGKCVRASAGSLFHVPVVTGVRFADVADRLRAGGLRLLAADGTARRDLDALLDEDALSAPTAWVFGNEAWGLPEDLLAHADEAVAVPIHGRAESLNLATAAAVCLYASARAQRYR